MAVAEELLEKRVELREEAGIEVESMQLRGTISWPGFGKDGEDWFGFLFLIERFRGEPRTTNEEGELEWVELDRVESLPLWEGDRYFLPLVFDRTTPVFHGVMPYADGRPTGWTYSR